MRKIRYLIFRALYALNRSRYANPDPLNTALMYMTLYSTQVRIRSYVITHE